MLKFGRWVLLVIMLTSLSLGLAACGADASGDVAAYAGASPFQADQTTQDTFKKALSGVKEARLQTFTTKDDPAAVRSYYESQFKDKGWTDKKDEIAEAAKQQESQNGWALAYEKGNRIMSVVLTSSGIAAGRFSNAPPGENVIVVISASK